MKTKNYYRRIWIALIFLVNPNIHVVDLLPDFIAYFLLFSVLSEAAGLSPHFTEARDAAKRLAILELFKIPASLLILVARSSNTMDTNLIPTFAIIFSVFEMILGYTFIYHASEALFYLGERTNATALIRGFRIRKGDTSKRSALYRTHQPEVLRNLSLVFVFAKAFGSFVPELLLLTRKQEYVGDIAGQTALLRLYPYALILSMLLVLLVGIYWLMLSRAYFGAVREEGRFFEALYTIAGNALIQKKERQELCASYVLGLSITAIANLFSLNFMPIFGYVLFLFIGACWLRPEGFLRLALRIFGIAALLCSLTLSLLIEMFEYDYGYKSLLNNPEAVSAYAPCILMAAINSAIILCLLTAVFLTLRRLIYRTLGLSPKNERYGRTERKFHRSLSLMNWIFYLFGILCTVCRGIYVYLRGQAIFIPSSAVSIGTISHKMEFWPLILMLIAIPHIFYSFYYTGVMKDEIKLALDEEE